MKEFLDFLNILQCEYLSDVSLAEYTTFRAGGNCAVMAFPDTESKIADILKYVLENDIRYYIIGKGSNMLFSDEGFDGVIINTVKLDYIELTDENIVNCACGTPLIKLCRFALENSLSGLEFAYGIPGSVGGAVYMNAGAYGGEIKDVISECRYIDSNGIIRVMRGDDMKMSYRKSIFSSSDDMLILSASFKLIKSEYDGIKEKMNELMARRKEKQPLEYPSAGSTFKRPEGYYAGALIEECGLKGYCHKGAMVSDKHAGFIINKDNASASDIIHLIKYCQQKVYEKKGVMLETEVKIIE